MAKNAEKLAAKKQTTKKPERTVPRVSKEFEEVTKLVIKVHRRALKELEKY